MLGVSSTAWLSEPNMIRGGDKQHRAPCRYGEAPFRHQTTQTARRASCLATAPALLCWNQPTNRSGLLSSELGMDGSIGHALEVPNDGTAGREDPPRPGPTAQSGMDGQEVFRRAVTEMSDSSASVLEQVGLGVDDVRSRGSASGQHSNHRRHGASARGWTAARFT